MRLGTSRPVAPIPVTIASRSDSPRSRASLDATQQEDAVVGRERERDGDEDEEVRLLDAT